ncbi:transcription regulator protein BACH1-like [Lampris incognitus]|uniref:transcription regulator protein BACH1-like n=1 Tax=Lampris incognitus TaxID=2546036 RepID=UPI0024B5B063|nr:transcription regulator protein BACH1-like [Lampris incognitus]XP_056139327.1 transcription regulator protein BACH1-like [Lampris incognitus]
MSLQAPRTSTFTFQSAVHSAHVLQCLNEQRQRDVLCDVTVVVDSRMFRAHCSVLASCSDYFQSRVTNITRQNSIITLPDEVTVEGFEPLLQFAYTSTLLFNKDNIHAIHRSAEFLGFLNVEKACFDFLIPKFSKDGKPAREDSQRGCCQNRTPSEGLGPIIEVSQPKSPESCSSVASGDLQIDLPSQCPQNMQGQTSRGKEHFCLENCGPQMSPLSLGLTANSVCPILSMPCSNTNKPDHSSQFCERDILEIGGVCDQSELSLVDSALSCELSSTGGVSPPALIEATGGEVHQTVETINAESKCDTDHSPLSTSGVQDSSELLEQTTVSLEDRMSVDLLDPTLSCISNVEGSGERSSVEREVAEHLAKGFWPDPCPSQTQSLPLDPIDQNNLTKAADFHWLKQLDLSSSTGDCPFLRDLGADEEHAPATDSLSQSEKSPYMSSLLNSGEDSDLDTDGDTEANIKKAEEVQLPFPVKQISVLSRSAFLQLLKHQHLNQKQLEFVHEVRRRSKNRIAAQRCRKRKLESIHILECEICTLRSEKERLIHERSQLEQNLEETRQSLFGLCKSVSLESSPEQDHLQLFAKLSSADCPISAFLVPMSSPSLLGKDQDCQLPLEKLTFPPEGKPENSIQNKLPQTNPHTEERGSQQSCFVTASFLNA